MLPAPDLTDEESFVIASLALHLLQDEGVLDAVSLRSNVDTTLLAKLRAYLDSHENPELDIPAGAGSAYEAKTKTAGKKEISKTHDISVLIRCFTKGSLSGMQVFEGLTECPREDLAEWITQTHMEWRPHQQRRRRSCPLP